MEMRSLPRVCLLLGFLVLGFASLVHGEEPARFKTRDTGRVRLFEHDASEVVVSRGKAGGAEARGGVETRIAGSSVIARKGNRTTLKLAAGLDRRLAAAGRDVISKAEPGAEIAPVLYEKGRPRELPFRRVVTREILAQVSPGWTTSQIASAAGAQNVAVTAIPDRVMLTMPNAFAALDAYDVLLSCGIEADLQLEREVEKRFTPNDPFYPQQWHLRNNGRSNGIVGIDANVSRAHDFTKGAGVSISIVDDCLETTHPDLSPNCPPLSSGKHHDFNSGDNNPAPDQYDGHGTSVGGVAAAKGNNNVGVSGAAPDAELIGLRLISGPFSDSEGASALYWRPPGLTVGVSNNSWGPFDGSGISGPDILTKRALENAATEGRGGRGQVTVFAAGNGKQRNDDSNLDGFANSRFVLAVAACTNQGKQSPYSEPGANILVTAPSNGGTLGVFTTDVTGEGGYSPGPGQPADRNYTNSFGGTSSASPLTAGGVALLLATNPELGWRDVHEILATTARQIEPGDDDWLVNGGGFKFNHKFGGGMIDLTAAVLRAQDWQNLPPETTQGQTLSSPNVPAVVPDNNATGITRMFDFSGQPNLRVEHIELTANIEHSHRSDLEIVVTAPSGMRSVMVPNRSRPNASIDDDIDYTDGGEGWSFTSTHHWGENSEGVWTLTLRDRASGTSGTLRAATLNLFGSVEETTQRVSFKTQRQSVIESAGSATIQVERIGSLGGAVSVAFAASANGTATVDEDYSAVSGTIDFVDGQQFADITVPILDDATPEGPESIYLLLKNPVNTALGGINLAQIDVVDDDGNFISIKAPDPEAREANSGTPTDPGLFTISRAAPDNSELVVRFAISGSARNGEDYTSIASQVTIPAFETAASVLIKPIDDASTEVGEPAVLTIIADPNYTVGLPDSALVTIVDNDLQKVEITAPVGTVSEAGTPVSFRVTRNASYPGSLIVKLGISGSARPGIHYEILPELVEIPADQSFVDVPVIPIDDEEYTPSKFVVVELVESSDYLPGFRRDARINIAENDPLPDARLPVVTISLPAKNARISGGQSVVASGSARDNGEVKRVLYRMNGGAWNLAEGVANWTADLTPGLVAGLNTLQVSATDDAGNEAKTVSRTFTYVKLHTLSVAAGNGGTVSGVAATSTREAGKLYTVKAVPADGFVFESWTGDLTSSSRSLTFMMPDADTSLIANFVPNPFGPSVTGTYTGLVRADAFAFATSGSLSVTVGSSGAFTGSLVYGADTFPLKGEFTGSGIFHRDLPRKGNPIPLAVDLVLDLAGEQRVSGSVSTPNFSSAVTAERTEYHKRNNVYAPALSAPVRYTLIFPPLPGLTSQQPRGNGVATMTIDLGGRVKWKGTLPDGSAAVGASALSKSGRWPFFLHAYKRKGVLLGDVILDEQQQATDLSGVLDWSKPPRSKDALFPLGFVVEQTPLIGSLYRPPFSGQRVLSAFDSAPGNRGTVSFTEGNLRQGSFNREFSEPLTLSNTNKLTFIGANPYRTKLTISTSDGRFTGEFVNPFVSPPSGKATPVTGVIFQKQQRAAGTFKGTIAGSSGTLQTGVVTLLPTPPPAP